MRHISLLAIFLLVLTSMNAQSFNEGKITSSLLENIQAQSQNEYHDIYIMLSDQVDSKAMDEVFYQNKTSLRERSETIINALQAKAAKTQPFILKKLIENDDVVEGSIVPLWINNSIYVKVKAATIAQLSNLEEVELLDLNHPMEMDSYQFDGASEPSPNGKEIGHTAINAHKMWALGYTGYGRKAYIIDTGADQDHPALNFQYWGRHVPEDEAWSGTGLARDCDNHGTHVTGTICGLDRLANDTIGVAFNASWMAAPPISCNQNTMLSTQASLQWAINPDGDNATNEDQPDVINNSWASGTPGQECNSNWVNVFNSIEAAGIAVVYSAGNSGPGVSTITSPKNISTDLVNVFCVGNLNASTLNINSGSSRGPSECGGSGSLLIKPEVSAPGTNVRSSVPNGGYSNFTGTSMAAPHTSGAVLLLKEAFPYLTGTEIKLALYYSCTDLGVNGEDNTYGMGIINVVAAYDSLVAQGNVPEDPSAVNDVAIIDLENPERFYCQDQLFMDILIQNSGSSPLTSTTITCDFGNGTIETFNWTGNLATNERELVALNFTIPGIGNYEPIVTATLPNGMADERPLNSFMTTIVGYIDNALSTPGPSDVCAGGEILLTATHPSENTLRWYATPSSTNPLGEETFLAGPISNNITYYVDNFTLDTIGKTDPDDGIGATDANNEGYLIFDAHAPFILNSVLVRVDNPGVRRFEVQSANGNVLASKIITLEAGDQRVIIDLNVPAGEDLRLALGFGEPLFFNYNNAAYPYDIENIVTITGNSSGNQFRYYYFFDWEIEYGNPCGRVPVEVNVVNDNFSADFSSLGISNSTQVSFTDLSIGSTSWFWDFGDGSTSSDQNPIHQYQAIGDYTVTFYADGPNGCGDGIEQDITVSILDNVLNLPKEIGSIDIYPNPSKDILSLDFDLIDAQNVQIEIVDVLGRTVLTELDFNIQNGKKELNVSSLSQGQYFIKINVGDTQYTKKITKL